MPELIRANSSRFSCSVMRSPAAMARAGGRRMAIFLRIIIFLCIAILGIGFGGIAEVVFGAGAGAAAEGAGAAGAAAAGGGGGAADGAGAAGAL